MEGRAEHTIQTLLEELKKSIPEFKVGQIFETLKSIYPDNDVIKEKKVIEYKGKFFTKPFAASRKDKRKYIKENSSIINFFKNKTKGDFLQIIEANGYTAKCINISLNEEIKNKYYSDDVVNINFNMIANSTIKQFKKKVDKYLD